MELIEKIDRIIDDLEKKRSTLFGQDFGKYPVKDYVAEFKAYTADRYYNYFSDQLRDRFALISSKYKIDGINLYQKSALACMVRDAITILDQKRYPLDINSFCEQWFKRIVGDFDSMDDSFYSSDNDLFIKDMGVASYRIIPAGTLILCVGGVGRGFLKSWNPVSVCRNGWFALSKMKGFRPFIEIHMDNRWLHEFSPEGWKRSYVRIAHFLKAYPDIKGMVGGSWFFDPKLVNISPHLAYLRKIPEDHGAGVFKNGISEHGIKDALFASKTRRALFEKGEYIPTSYTVIWCRDDLIAWADAYEKHCSGK